jgi:uncharacterized protein (TIGR03067 family)
MIASSRFVALTLVFVSFASIRAVGGPETIPNDSDLGRLQGRWIARAGARHEIGVILHVHGRSVDVAISTPQGLHLKVHGEVKLDDTTTPRRVDWIKFTGADQEEFPPIPGIYKLDRDIFTVCNGGMNGSRPTEFKAGDGVLSEVVVFRREVATAVAKGKPASEPRR